MRSCWGFALELRAGWDRLRPSEMQPEQDHNLTGEKTKVGLALGHKWREAGMDDWFEAQLLLLARTP